MKWREIIIFTVPEAEEIISNIFLEVGANGVYVHGFKNMPANVGIADDYDDGLEIDEPFSVSAFYPSDGSDITILQNIQRRVSDLRNLDLGVPLGSLEVLNHIVNESDWENAWKNYFKPLQVSDFFVVKPSWEDYRQSEGEIIIEIDPGMAFGTGTHESTRMCIRMLEEYVCDGMTVVDLGSGSGILSIAASKLGAKKVYALDIDKNAVEITKQNLALNGVDSGAEVLCSDLLEKLDPNIRADVMVVNIVADVILRLAPCVPHFIKKNGMLICSGIIDTKIDMVVQELEKYGFRVIQILSDGEWRAVACKYKVK